MLLSQAGLIKEQEGDKNKPLPPPHTPLATWGERGERPGRLGKGLRRQLTPMKSQV